MVEFLVHFRLFSFATWSRLARSEQALIEECQSQQTASYDDHLELSGVAMGSPTHSVNGGVV